MSGCFCAALAELSVLSDDPREETRLRRTLFGIEIQRWRLASTGRAPKYDRCYTKPPRVVGELPGHERARQASPLHWKLQ